eukprot:SAG11_NODE_2429_length_3371_cov_5.133863_3_plen_117_part_00
MGRINGARDRDRGGGAASFARTRHDRAPARPALPLVRGHGLRAQQQRHADGGVQPRKLGVCLRVAEEYQRRHRDVREPELVHQWPERRAAAKPDLPQRRGFHKGSVQSLTIPLCCV